MNTQPQRLLAFALMIPLVAGCFGVPDGAADVGDLVVVRYSATDPATGEVLVENATATFALGSGDSGFGPASELELRGHSQDETVSIESRNVAARGFSVHVTREAVFNGTDINGTVPRADFEAALGNASVGMQFRYGQMPATVTSVTANEVGYALDVEERRDDARDDLGADVLVVIEGNQYHYELDPAEGHVFSVSPSQAAQHPLGLLAGTYRVVGREGNDIAYEWSRAPSESLAREDLDLEVTLVTVLAGDDAAVPTDGKYGVRTSPQVLGDPHSALEPDVIFVDADEDAGHADDGHADDGHADDGH